MRKPSSDEIVGWVVVGDVEFEIEGEAHRPLPGDEPLIPAGASHTVRNLGRSESRWLCRRISSGRRTFCELPTLRGSYLPLTKLTTEDTNSTWRINATS
jgi:glyoxylate utilization-related uncharacterized protein